MSDTKGRPWLTLAEAQPSATVSVDEGFTCIRPRSLRVIHCDEGGRLYIECRSGHHYLDGQLNHTHYIGLYFRRSPPT